MGFYDAYPGTPPAVPPVAAVEAVLWTLLRDYDDLRRENHRGRMEPSEYEAALGALVRETAKAAGGR